MSNELNKYSNFERETVLAISSFNPLATFLIRIICHIHRSWGPARGIRKARNSEMTITTVEFYGEVGVWNTSYTQKKNVFTVYLLQVLQSTETSNAVWRLLGSEQLSTKKPYSEGAQTTVLTDFKGDYELSLEEVKGFLTSWNGTNVAIVDR